MELMQKLQELGSEAWRRWPKDAPSRRQYIINELSGDRTWSLISSYSPQALVQAVGWLLNRTKPVQDADDDLIPRVAQDTTVVVEQPTAARPAVKPMLALRRSAAARKRAEMIAAKSAVASELSKLDSIFINGKPIGDCTVAVVRNWMGRCTHKARIASIHARFAGALIANLPSQAIVRHWWTNPDEVDAIYARAEAEYAV